MASVYGPPAPVLVVSVGDRFDSALGAFTVVAQNAATIDVQYDTGAVVCTVARESFDGRYPLA